MKLSFDKREAALWLPVLTIVAATMQPASADLLLKYDFEGAADTTIPNTAPGAAVNGTLNHADQTQVLSGETVTVNGVAYLLGKVLKFTPGISQGAGTINDALNSTDAPHVDSGLLMSNLGVTATTDYTAMAWVNFGSQTGDNMVFGSSAGTFLHLGSRGVNYHSGHYGDDLTVGTTVIGQWHHVAYVNQGQTQTIYVDGVSIGTGATGAGSMDPSFPVLIGTSGNAGSFVGSVDEVKIFNSALTQPEIQSEQTAGLPVYNLATRESQRLGNNGLTITIKDSATSQVNPATLALQFDGVTVTPAPPVKNGAITSVFYAVTTAQASPHTWSLTVQDQNNTTISLSGAVTSPYLPPSLNGPAGTAGTWGMRELRPAAALAGDGLVSAVAVATAADAGTYVDAVTPVVNHCDPDSAGDKGNFNNDLPFIGNQPGDDNNVVVVAKTIVTIPEAGNWTFDVHSDDGFGMRVKGGKFISTNGPGGIDPADPECLIHPADTGDSNTRGVCSFPEGGTFEVEFIGFEKGGGAFWEVAWARGSFAEEKETAWTLVGSPNDPAVTAIPFTPRWLTPVPGPKGAEGTLGMRVYYRPVGENPAATTPDNLTDVFNFLSGTDRTPLSDPDNTFDRQEATINHRDPGSSGGQTGLIGGELEFPPNTPVDMPRTNQDRVVVTAHGRIRVSEAGDYTFNVHGDDGFLLRLTKTDGTRPSFKKVSGLGTFRMSNPNEMYQEAGTGDTSTRGIIALEAADYDVEFVEWEGVGGWWTEVTYAKGAFPNDGDTTSWRLLNYAPQPGNFVKAGIANPGWTVLSTAPGNASITSLQTAQDAINLDSTSSTWDVINFFDPEAGSASSIGGDSPWPRNTPGDDNNYAMQMTGTLVIPVTGDYFFGFRGDDGSSLQIEGQEWLELPVNATGAAFLTNTEGGPVNDRIALDIGTGDSRTVGRIHLEAGNYTIRSLFFEMGGGSSYEIVGAQAQPVYDPFAPLPLLAKGTAGQPLDTIATLRFVGTAPVTNDGFTITAVSATGNPVGNVQLTWKSEAGKSYAIEATTDPAATWTTLSDDIESNGASTSATVSLSSPFAGNSRVFFRIRAQ